MFDYWWIISRGGTMFRIMCNTDWYCSMYDSLGHANRCLKQQQFLPYSTSFTFKLHVRANKWRGHAAGWSFSSSISLPPTRPKFGCNLSHSGCTLSDVTGSSGEALAFFSEIRCLSLCASVMSSSVPHRQEVKASFLCTLILDQVTLSLAHW